MWEAEMFIPYTVVNPLLTVRIPRLLSETGQVLVRPGDSVTPSQVVAQAVRPGDFRIVEVAQELGIPARNAGSYLKVERGQAVSEGDILAARGGLSSQACYAPLTGRVVGVGRGRLLLEAEAQVVRLTALVPGYVVESREGTGVIIETVGALIQGYWGNEHEGYGTLRILVRDARHPIRASHINASSQGAILIGGSTVDEESIAQAVELQVRGMIVGSIPPDLIPLLRETPLPVIATEGIGTTPMSAALFDLLRSLDGREAALCAKIGSRWKPTRPYIVVPMPTRAAPTLNPDVPLQPGDRVRILRGEYRARSGTVSRLLEGLIQVETGARVEGVEVTLNESERVQVPQANIERLL
jgi:hypothetical protein